MERREFVATAACLGCGLGSGCTTEVESESAAIGYLELENHRRDGSYAFAVRIEDGNELVFEETVRLERAGSGRDAAAFEKPVAGPGAYSVRVDVDDHAAIADTRDLSDAADCLGLQFYLGDRTLHVERRPYQRCE